MRRLVIALASASFVVGLMAGTAFAGNPSGTGQPSASCEQSVLAPNGFGTGGFANAAAHYAGNGAPSLNANSGNAVSQYDVACYQVSLHH